MENKGFNSIIKSLLDSLNDFISTKCVVGEEIKIDDIILVPLSDIVFGMGAGAIDDNSKNTGTGGIGGKVSPNSILVIKNDSIKLINIKNKDSIEKGLDIIKDIISKIKEKKNKN